MGNDFIDDRDKMNDILWLTREHFSTRRIPIKTVSMRS